MTPMEMRLELAKVLRAWIADMDATDKALIPDRYTPREIFELLAAFCERLP